jgi:hypothetical protein
MFMGLALHYLVKREYSVEYKLYKKPIIFQFNKYVKLKRNLAKYPNIKWPTFIDPIPHVSHNMQITVQLLESECMPVLI